VALEPLAISVPAGVEVLSWPRDAALRRHLARVGVPRIVVAPAQATLPATADDPAEVWAIGDESSVDLDAAADRLVRDLRRIDRAAVMLDGDGVATRADRRVSLSVSESVVAAALIAEPGRVVPRDRLRDLLGAHGERSERAVEAGIYRLRRRLIALHVVILTVRSRGFALEAAAAGRCLA
jgi:DNA-binding response OmpR family regulator